MPADALNECLSDKSKNAIESLVNFVHAEKPQELSNIKTPKHHVTIPAGEQVSIKCNMDRVVFEEKIQPVITTRIYVLHKITIALKFMSYINSDLQIPAKKLQTPG